MRALVIASLLAVSTHAAAACENGEVQLFGCQTADKDGELSEDGFAFCAGDQDTNGDFETIYYEYASPKGVDLRYPDNPADGKARLLFHHYFKDKLYHARIRFETGGYSYEAYYDANPPSEDPDEIVGPDAGVRVRKGNELVADIMCGERPSSYFDDVRKLTSCDTSNPYGEAACASDAPEVK